MLNTGLTRGLNRGLQRLTGGGVRVILAPPDIANFSYYPAGPQWSFSDAAGVVPCAVGDAIWTQKPFGTGVNFVQASSGARPILRQDSNGKYYREYAVGRWMVATVAAVGANTPFAYCSAIDVVGTGINAQFIGNGNIGAAGAGMFIGQSGGGLVYMLYAQAGSTTYSTLTTGKQSIIATGTAVALSTSSVYKNGVALSVALNTQHLYGPRDANLIENSRFPDSFSQGTANLIYGSGYKHAGALTVDEIALLDTYQRKLYTP